MTGLSHMERMVTKVILPRNFMEIRLGKEVRNEIVPRKYVGRSPSLDGKIGVKETNRSWRRGDIEVLQRRLT